jgi:hypothetical protein
MNLPTKAQDVHASLANAFNTGNVDIVMSMYDNSRLMAAGKLLLIMHSVQKLISYLK